MSRATAQDAIDLARKTESGLSSHELLCEERYRGIEASFVRTEASFARIESILKWAGTTLIMVLIAVIGYLAKSQIDINHAERRAVDAKVEYLEKQM